MNEMTRIAAQPAYSEAVQAFLKRAPKLFIDPQADDGLRFTHITSYSCFYEH